MKSVFSVIFIVYFFMLLNICHSLSVEVAVVCFCCDIFAKFILVRWIVSVSPYIIMAFSPTTLGYFTDSDVCRPMDDIYRFPVTARLLAVSNA